MAKMGMLKAPIRFAPLYMPRVWGGRRLATLFGRSLPDGQIGESWDVSDRPEAMSQVSAGPLAGMTLHDLWTTRRAEIFGEALIGHPSPSFPLLMKVLDACDDLSIQVHPPASVANRLGGEPKTEMWVIAHAEPGAKLYVGVRPGVDRDVFESAIRDGDVADKVNVIQPSVGDCLFIPSGRLHAIGKGLVLFEVQQSSDTTYRVFDWNRVGLDGKPRDLHIEASLESIDFNDREPRVSLPAADGTLTSCSFFDVKRRTVDSERDIVQLGEPGENLTIAMLSGALGEEGSPMSAADFAIIPACLSPEQRRFEFQPGTSWLEIRIPLP